jgi:hypothetical protein
MAQAFLSVWFELKYSRMTPLSVATPPLHLKVTHTEYGYGCKNTSISSRRMQDIPENGKRG